MNKSENNVYLSLYSINPKARLWTQLACLVSGLNFKNVLYALKCILKVPDSVDLRKLTYEDLTEEQIKQLEKSIESQQIHLGSDRSSIAHANLKDRTCSETFATEVNYESTYRNLILLNDNLKAEKKINIQRLIKMNCYVGNRHFKKLKVHGQRTKSTGRKNKIARGFIKKKKEKKLEKLASKNK